MRAILILILCILSSLTVNAQIDTYPLDQYKRPTLRRSTFVLDGYIDSDSGFRSNSDNDASALTVNLNSFYTKFKNDKKTQSTIIHLTRINTDIDFKNDEKQMTNLQHLSRYSVRRFNEKNTFFGISPEIQIDSEIGSAFNSPERRVGTALPIGVGKGRIEIVNDAWLATSILEALKDEGKLKREPTHQEITYLAEEIARIKNARILDFRNKMIYELDEIYTYILNLGLVEESTLAFAILYDAWRYEIFTSRSSGRVLESYITPSYYFRFGEDQFNYSNQRWSLTYRNYKPINLKWETRQILSIDFSSTFDHAAFSNPKLEQIQDNLQGRISGSYQIEYFLSRRTNFSLYNYAAYRKAFESDYTITTFITTFRWVHWLSPQLRIISNLRINSNLQKFDTFKTNTVYPDFNFSVQYSVF